MEMNLNGLEEWGLIVGLSCLPDDGPKTGILYLREERIFDDMSLRTYSVTTSQARVQAVTLVHLSTVST